VRGLTEIVSAPATIMKKAGNAGLIGTLFVNPPSAANTFVEILVQSVFGDNAALVETSI
jgi:hypothetical protein